MSKFDNNLAVLHIENDCLKPKMVNQSNNSMGSVDKFDSVVAVYRSRIRQRGYY